MSRTTEALKSTAQIVAILLGMLVLSAILMGVIYILAAIWVPLVPILLGIGFLVLIFALLY